MIYEKDLDDSIARYMGEPEPSINTCIKLASCLTVKRELFGEPEQLSDSRQLPEYSFAAEPVEPVDTHIRYTSDTDFSRAIDGKDPADVWPILDELMAAVQIQLPRLYDNIISRLQV